ncbi:MAG: galactokinase family protein [Lachnospiraceae bacterium]|jgi:galactokinase|nr:galactokinase family protein [Lachnospiraceae bacterium]MEE3460633.1 galactokinase family protein [Lachnospiraceae bacterium]
METINSIEEKIMRGELDTLLTDVYVDEKKIPYEKERYLKALKSFGEYFDEKEVGLYSAPGRTEVGGNHTDHQHGEVLCASINDDAIAVVSGADDIRVLSEGYDMITIGPNELDKAKEEEGTTRAIIKGVVGGLKKRGYKAGGFHAYITSDVLQGSGLSSSAAFETIIGTVISGLYNDMKVSPVVIAQVGQYAENEYFGKPCGLMDQMACSVGSLCHIDFKDNDDPKVEKVDFDFNSAGYTLCITDTKGSHADLTDEYAAIPAEMKKVAAVLGREVLEGTAVDDLTEHAAEIREKCGDRAFLRAMHFVNENIRVRNEVNALKEGNITEFFKNVKASGDSSFKYLQNVYTNKDVEHQNVSVALAISDLILKCPDCGVSRVHGGGFAGTMQAFVRKDLAEKYMEAEDQIFGQGACRVYQIRRFGGMKLI